MELKHDMRNIIAQSYLAFNRTIVELKHDMRNIIAQSYLAFNRTIVELKQSTLRYDGVEKALLIVP